MIPVLGVPTVGEQELLDQMLRSVNHPVGDLVVVDNSRAGVTVPELDNVERTWHLHMPSNFGVAGSWNLIIKSTPFAPWWLIVNCDVVFAPDAASKVVDRMDGWSGILVRPRPFAPWGAFAMSEATVAEFGLFDEYYHPIYYEDTDYMQRAQRAGHPVVFDLYGIPDVSPGGSLAFRRPEVTKQQHSRLNATANANRQFFAEQWAGGDPKPKRGWDLSRRRELSVDDAT